MHVNIIFEKLISSGANIYLKNLFYKIIYTKFVNKTPKNEYNVNNLISIIIYLK